MGSRWSNLRGFSRYKVSDKGKVYDFKLRRLVGIYYSSDGYCKVTLRRNDNKRKSFSVHRLVAICFIPNPLKLPEVNHKNGVKRDNSYKNLEWMTHAQNIQHAWDNKLLKDTKQRSEKLSKALTGLNMGKDNHKARMIYCITTKETFDCMSDAIKKYNISQAQLSKCCIGYKGAKSAGKHPVTGKSLRWRYADA